jgi:intein/homing endonuclease
MGRAVFVSTKIRDVFFEKSLKISGFKFWKELADFLKINRKVFYQYRNGSLTLPLALFEMLISKFPNEDKNYFFKKIEFLDLNWGKSKGGRIAYFKNKKFFNYGRMKACEIKISKANVFDINMPLTEELCYFIGLFIGDGFANKYNSSYLVQFTGQYSKELNYYNDLVVPLGRKYFNLVPNIKKGFVGDILRVNYCSKCLHDFFVKRLKIKPGRKSHCVLIPEEIFLLGGEYLLSFIAGFYDAEGCFYFVERKEYRGPYPILELHINNDLLIRQISDFLLKIGIKNSSWKNKRIVIYGEEEIVNFLVKVKIKNPKLIENIPKNWTQNLKN